MSEPAYTVRDRRGGQNSEPQEVCRVCGAPVVHSHDYNKPTMDCIEHLRSAVSDLDKKCQEWATAMQSVQQAQPEDKNIPRRFRWPVTEGTHPNGSNTKWRYGLYFPQTDLCVGDMGDRGTGVPEFSGLEWIDPKPIF